MRLTAIWVVAAGLAVAVGVLAVRSAGADLRGRGPIGNPDLVSAAEIEGRATPDPNLPVLEDTFSGDYGRFVVGCQGVFASTIDAVPAPGWRVVSIEPGPDDDVDAIFSSGRRSVELEVYCNRGRPRLAELESKTLPVG